ncbi:MAG: M15 family metallopeptidase [Victivallales bacterium]|jgi:D-alanyl-D-alanine dipeptidase
MGFEIKNNDSERREYWMRMLDKADAFMQAVTDYPVKECREPMVSLEEAARAEKVEVVFSDLPHMHGLSRLFYLRTGLIGQFLAVAREMNERGWMLKVEEGYRTMEMQKSLLNRNIFSAILCRVQWECGCYRPQVDLLYRRIGALVALSPKLGTHMSGSAMDVSVLLRDTGGELDRGGRYLEMSELTPMDSPFIAEQSGKNRREITGIMHKHGFVDYPFEFWHYNDGDAYSEYLNNTRRPARYGAVHMNSLDGSVTPIENPVAPLISTDVIREMMDQILAEQPEKARRTI